MSRRRTVKRLKQRESAEPVSTKKNLRFLNSWACEYCWRTGRLVEFKFSQGANRSFTTNRALITCPVCKIRMPHTLSKWSEQHDRITGDTPLWRATFLPGVMAWARNNLEIVQTGKVPRDERQVLTMRKNSNDFTFKQYQRIMKKWDSVARNKKDE